ncbi:hypothetical protein [Streptomyces sp. IBSBF 3136]|uniref:hypothetical protein n=1 Tax=Streptomyces sp. IBSBF 3136 TaxID=2903524 RepID=UPI002FDC4B6F
MEQETESSESLPSKSNEMYESLWASPSLFTFASVVVGVLTDSDRGHEMAWWVYFAGWVPLLLMGVFWLVSGRKPAKPAAQIGVGVLVLFGVVQGVFNSGGWPL